MRRDSKLIDLLVLEMANEEVDLSAYSPEQLNYHRQLLVDGGYAEGKTYHRVGDSVGTVALKNLTASGRRYAENLVASIDASVQKAYLLEGRPPTPFPQSRDLSISHDLKVSSMLRRDVFLCHASADKSTHVRPFAAALATKGITYWIDEAEILWGDRITEKINQGLARSRYVVVFLTETFLERRWPQVELESALNLEASSGAVVVLPIMAAPEDQVLDQYPLLRDKLYLRWQDGVDSIVSALARKVGVEFKTNWSFSHPASYSGQVWIQVVAQPENRSLAHHCFIHWGPWESNIVLNLGGRESATLVHIKRDDGLSVPIIVEISPPCHVVFGEGDPPAGPVDDINLSYTRVNAYK